VLRAYRGQRTAASVHVMNIFGRRVREEHAKPNSSYAKKTLGIWCPPRWVFLLAGRFL